VRVKIAMAPVNFGIYSAEDPVIGPEEYARLAVECGYEGTDLGPYGYLTTVLDNGLPLAGGWHDLRFGQASGFDEDLVGLEATIRLLRDHNQYPDKSPYAPKPTLACPPSPALSAADWGRLVRQTFRAASRCRANGLDPVFHHHMGTSIETPEEIDRLMALTELGLCLDTGHLLAAGGDPLDALESWGDRVRHVHVKDTLPDGAFCRLGDGMLDLDAFIAALDGLGYEGWIVVEQDAPAEHQDLEQIVSDLLHNRSELARLGL
jgi:inosose dehydratase